MFILPDIMHQLNNRKLEPYESMDVTIQHIDSVVQESENLKSFVVFDTTGKEWKPSQKIWYEFLQNLKSKKTSTSWLIKA